MNNEDKVKSCSRRAQSAVNEWLLTSDFVNDQKMVQLKVYLFYFLAPRFYSFKLVIAPGSSNKIRFSSLSEFSAVS